MDSKGLDEDFGVLNYKVESMKAYDICVIVLFSRVSREFGRTFVG